uniref:Uncharacterized protein n=1 Tax=Pyxicephalus adspersus TaxID=30357 RepID=A0AAV3AHA5_PYXAD|nr:TPA: hypothetical protein GDO54_014648 [Pyxicephalus adspersus]
MEVNKSAGCSFECGRNPTLFTCFCFSISFFAIFAHLGGLGWHDITPVRMCRTAFMRTARARDVGLPGILHIRISALSPETQSNPACRKDYYCRWDLACPFLQ